MREFTHQIRFEDIIYKIDKDLMEINPEITVSCEKKQYITLTGRERENIAFNILIATGYNIINELLAELVENTEGIAFGVND